MAWNIMVICLGNICRSPMAEAFLKKRIPDSKIISAGLERATSGWHAEDDAVRAMTEHGIDISIHRAQPLTGDLLEDVDIVLTMEEDQVRIIRRSFPKFKGIVKRLCDGTDVEDPYGYSFSMFERFVNRFQRAWMHSARRLPSKYLTDKMESFPVVP